MNTTIRAQRVKHLCACLTAALGIVAGRACAGVLPSVSNCTDDEVVGTLRNVLAQVTFNGAVVNASYCSSITLTQGELATGFSVTISGKPMGTTTIDANYLGRAFHGTNSTALYNNLTLTSLTVIHGRDYTTDSNATGACILGTNVTLNDSVVSDCIAKSSAGGAYGGAIRGKIVTLSSSRVEKSSAYSDAAAPAGGGGVFASAEFHCDFSSISGNHAASVGGGNGGGVSAFGALSMTGCTVAGNVSADSGGIAHSGLNAGDTVSIASSTISSNRATGAHGALYTDSPLTLTNATVAFNAAPYCGGAVSRNNISVDSSIVAGNTSDNASCVDLKAVNGHTISGANNLVSVVNSAVPFGALVANPRLTPLADHGGPTFTHGLSVNSPAIDAGSAGVGVFTDQRGFNRTIDAGVDIGAFERQAGDDELFYGGFE